MHRAEILQDNLNRVEKIISLARQKAGRPEGAVQLMAVTKYAQDQDVLALLAAGRLKHVGESRVQQAWDRWTNPVFAKYPVVKHFIGHLQKNKAAKAVRLFDFIDSVDSFELAEALNRHAAAWGKTQPVLLQVKLTEKDTQSGLPLPQARELARRVAGLSALKACGYMAIAPQTDDTALLRGLFGAVRRAFDEVFPQGEPRWLSLGMSADLAAAVEEGSTLPRVGSDIFARNLEDL